MTAMKTYRYRAECPCGAVLFTQVHHAMRLCPECEGFMSETRFDAGPVAVRGMRWRRGHKRQRRETAAPSR